MNNSRHRFGFTLVETMVATTAAGVILTLAVLPTYLYCQRMYAIAMQETECSLAIRKIRDRLLFHVSPEIDAGLLSGTATNDNASITVKWAKSNFPNDPDPQHPDTTHDNPDKIRIVWRNDNNRDAGSFFNERMAHDNLHISWLCPSSMLITNAWASTIDLPRIRLCVQNDGPCTADAWILLPK